MTIKPPQFLEHDGKPAFAVIPIKDYEALRERLEDLEDLALLREAELTDGDASGKSLEEVRREFGLDQTPADG